ncbi:MAG: DNA replication/repair protein RecF [Christensenellaceae bacterium]|nr:DNA replication/repair protein RecF [Christensenellaceae bacterium]
MYLKSIRLKNYRNIEYLELNDISKGITVFLGQNAQGKTNLIEAVNYLSCARSFRGVNDDALIKNGEERAEIGCRFLGSYNGRVDAALIRNGGRVIKVNGLPVKRVGDMIGRVNTVVFAPEDIRAIKDRPAVRRRLIDEEISKIKPSYYMLLQRYMDVLKNKNKLLKEEADASLIEVFNLQLIEYGSQIVERRRDFLNKISKIAKKNQTEITGKEEILSIDYKSCVEGEDIALEMANKLSNIMKKEQLFKTSLFGPQREDMDLKINGESLRLSASQGQQRTAMISFKLACAELGENELMDKPVLLLDDVFSELDKSRRERLINKVKNFQVFITVTDAVGAQEFRGIDFYKVSEGCFKKL